MTVGGVFDSYVPSAMGETPKSQEKSLLRTIRPATSLVRFLFYFLTTCVIYYVNEIEPVFQTRSKLTELLAVKPEFLRRGEHDSFRAEPNLYQSAFLHDVRRFKRIRQAISSLAFGGRGVGLLHGTQKRKGTHHIGVSRRGMVEEPSKLQNCNMEY